MASSVDSDDVRTPRTVREVADVLEAAPPPDPEFADDLQVVLNAVGPVPEDPWVQA